MLGVGTRHCTPILVTCMLSANRDLETKIDWACVAGEANHQARSMNFYVFLFTLKKDGMRGRRIVDRESCRRNILLPKYFTKYFTEIFVLETNAVE